MICRGGGGRGRGMRGLWSWKRVLEILRLVIEDFKVDI